MSSLLEFIQKNSLFEGVKGEPISWRCNINQLYQNWCKVAQLEQNLKNKDNINKFKCSLGVLKNAGSMINKSNQLLDSFRNPEETVKVITDLAYSLDENGNPSTQILNSQQNTPLRSLKTLLNITSFTNKTNNGKCEIIIYNSLLAFFCLNKEESEKEKIFNKLYEKTENFLENLLTNFGNKKKCNIIADKYIKALNKLSIFDQVKTLLGKDIKVILTNDGKSCMFKNTKEKSNNVKNLKSLFQNLKYNDYKKNCTDYWINYFYNTIICSDFKKSLSAVKGAQQFIDRCDFLKISLDEYYNINNLRGRIKDKILSTDKTEYKDTESILTSDILEKLGVKTCIRPRYNQKKMWDVVYESLKNNIQTCIINSSTMGSGKSVGSMLIPHIIKKIYKEKFAYIYTSYGEHLLGQHCDVLNFRENRGLMTPGALVLEGPLGPEFYFWYEGCNLPSAKDLKKISSGSGKANKNNTQRQIDRKTKKLSSNISSGRQIHKPFVFISDLKSIPKLVQQLQEDDYKTILVVDEPPLSASKHLSENNPQIMHDIMNCLTTNVDILIMMCATQPELIHMPKFNNYLNTRFERIVDVTENKIAQSTKIMFNDVQILPHHIRNDRIFYDTIRSPLNYRFYSLNDCIDCYKNYNPNNNLLQSEVINIANFQNQIKNVTFTNDQLVKYDEYGENSECNTETLCEQIYINKPFKTGNQILWIENIDINKFKTEIGKLIYSKKCIEITTILNMAIQKYGKEIPPHILRNNPISTFLRWMKENNQFKKLDKVFDKIKQYSWRYPPDNIINYAMIDPAINDEMLILLMNGIGFHYLKSNVYYKCVKKLRDDNLLAIYVAPLEFAFGTNMVLSAVVIDPKISNNLSPDLIRQLTGRVSRGLTENPGLILTNIRTIKKFLFERSPEAQVMEEYMPQ